MKNSEQIKKLVSASFGTLSEASLIIEKKTCIEFVMTSTITKAVVAVFSISKDNYIIFQIRCIDAGYIDELNLLATKLSEKFREENE